MQEFENEPDAHLEEMLREACKRQEAVNEADRLVSGAREEGETYLRIAVESDGMMVMLADEIEYVCCESPHTIPPTVRKVILQDSLIV